MPHFWAPIHLAHTNEKRGRAECPSPWVRPPALTGDAQRRRGRPYASLTRRRTLRIAERQRHEARGVALLHAQQHLMLALRLGIDQRLAHVADIGDRFAADVEDDGAGLKALLGGGAVRIDRRDYDALGAGA